MFAATPKLCSVVSSLSRLRAISSRPSTAAAVPLRRRSMGGNSYSGVVDAAFSISAATAAVSAATSARLGLAGSAGFIGAAAGTSTGAKAGSSSGCSKSNIGSGAGAGFFSGLARFCPASSSVK